MLLKRPKKRKRQIKYLARQLQNRQLITFQCPLCSLWLTQTSSQPMLMFKLQVRHRQKLIMMVMAKLKIMEEWCVNFQMRR